MTIASKPRISQLWKSGDCHSLMNACCTALVWVRHAYAYSGEAVRVDEPGHRRRHRDQRDAAALCAAPRALARSTSQRTSSRTAMPRNRKAMTKPPWKFAHASMTSGIA